MVLVALVIGLTAGWIASLPVGGGGRVHYIVSGPVSPAAGSRLGTDPIDNAWIRRILITTADAIIGIVAARTIG